MSNKIVTATVDSDETNGTWTDPIVPDFRHTEKFGKLNLSISGSSWGGTVTLQRRLPEMSDFEDVDTFTVNTQDTISEIEEGAEYRVGMKNGEYSSGTAYVRLSR